LRYVVEEEFHRRLFWKGLLLFAFFFSCCYVSLADRQSVVFFHMDLGHPDLYTVIPFTFLRTETFITIQYVDTEMKYNFLW